jgi:hypothetical protein
MKKNNRAAGLRNVVAFCLMVTVFVSTSMIALAKPGTSLAGEIIVSGHNTNGVEPSVMLNGERAYSGRTFFNAGEISTSENATATIKLGKLGYLNLAPNSVLSLDFTENSISGRLTAGDVKVFNSEGIAVNIENALTNMAVKPAKADDDDDDDDDMWIPILIFGGIVGAAVVYVVTNSSDDGSVVSPAR